MWLGMREQLHEGDEHRSRKSLSPRSSDASASTRRKLKMAVPTRQASVG